MHDLEVRRAAEYEAQRPRRFPDGRDGKFQRRLARGAGHEDLDVPDAEQDVAGMHGAALLGLERLAVLGALKAVHEDEARHARVRPQAQAQGPLAEAHGLDAHAQADLPPSGFAAPLPLVLDELRLRLAAAPPLELRLLLRGHRDGLQRQRHGPARGRDRLQRLLAVVFRHVLLVHLDEVGVLERAREQDEPVLRAVRLPVARRRRLAVALLARHRAR
mmetsp:Transcript_14054/g.41938  ORF Transcript_14054/g.41938 Transcript_14054/m.41938 type:complete len:218 (-) Transcript_14054:4112-4765(-)